MMTLCASTWESSQARVTSKKSFSSRISFNELLTLDSKSFQRKQNFSAAEDIFFKFGDFLENDRVKINNQTMNKTTITTAHTYLVVSIYFRLLHYLSHFVLSSRLVRFIWIEPELKWRFTSKGSVPPGRGFQTVIKPSCVVAMLAGLVWFGVDTASQFWRQKYTM